MKCPYAVNRRNVSQTDFQYDESGNQTFQQTIDHNTAEFVDCLKDDCGDGVTTGASITKLIRVVVFNFGNNHFFHTIFALAGRN